MTEDDDLEKRVRDLESFADELRGGRKLFIWVCSAIGAALALLGTFWNQLFGGSS